MRKNLFYSSLQLVFITGPLLFGLISTSVHAQAMRPSGLLPNSEQVQQIATRLQLDEDQRPQFQQIMQEQNTSTRALLEKHGINPNARRRPSMRVIFSIRSEMKRNMETTEKRLALILSPKQMREFRNMRNDQRSSWKKRRPRS